MYLYQKVKNNLEFQSNIMKQEKNIFQSNEKNQREKRFFSLDFNLQKFDKYYQK